MLTLTCHKQVSIHTSLGLLAREERDGEIEGGRLLSECLTSCKCFDKAELYNEIACI